MSSSTYPFENKNITLASGTDALTAILRRRLICSLALVLIVVAVRSGNAAAQATSTEGHPNIEYAQTSTPPEPPVENTFAIFSRWSEQVTSARASQPNWSSPLITTTGLLENRLRFDVGWLHSGNGTSTTLLDGGKGLDLIVGNTTEIQIAAAPYTLRENRSGSGVLAGFGDWPFFRIEERLGSSPQGNGDYVMTGLLQIQAPTGRRALSAQSWIMSPMLAFGKGWGDFDIQGTIAAALPMSHGETLGHQIQTNGALQYRLWNVLWPELEASWTYFPDGRRSGLHQLFLTAGVVLGRFTIRDGLRLTLGGGYEVAVAPSYRPQPLTPSFDHAWLLSSRLNFQ